jgi:hypothetical protein
MGSWSLILLVTGAMSGGLFFASAIDQFRFVFFCERESAPWDDFVKIIGMAIGQIIVTILVITAYYLF